MVPRPAILLIAVWGILAAVSLSCSGQGAGSQAGDEPPIPEKGLGLPIPDSGILVLMLDQDGLLQPLSEAPGSLGPGLIKTPDPAPFAIQKTLAAIQAPIDGGAILAINRSGLLYLALEGDLVQIRRVAGVDPEFAGRSVAQAWIWDNRALVLLHRNEIFETEPPRNPASLIIASGADGAVVLPSPSMARQATAENDQELYHAPYALFPRRSDLWLVQFRLAGQERTRTAFASWNPNGMHLDPLQRSEYERAVRPAPIAEAPPVVRLAAESFGLSLIMEVTMPDGTLQSWLQGGTETVSTIRSLFTDSGLICLSPEGHLVLVDGERIYTSTLAPPIPDASFRDLAFLDGCLLATWEEEIFPSIGRSGLVMIRGSLLKSSQGKRQGETNQDP